MGNCGCTSAVGLDDGEVVGLGLAVAVSVGLGEMVGLGLPTCPWILILGVPVSAWRLNIAVRWPRVVSTSRNVVGVCVSKGARSSATASLRVPLRGIAPMVEPTDGALWAVM